MWAPDVSQNKENDIFQMFASNILNSENESPAAIKMLTGLYNELREQKIDWSTYIQNKMDQLEDDLEEVEWYLQEIKENNNETKRVEHALLQHQIAFLNSLSVDNVDSEQLYQTLFNPNIIKNMEQIKADQTQGTQIQATTPPAQPKNLSNTSQVPNNNQKNEQRSVQDNNEFGNKVEQQAEQSTENKSLQQQKMDDFVEVVNRTHTADAVNTTKKILDNTTITPNTDLRPCIENWVDSYKRNNQTKLYKDNYNTVYSFLQNKSIKYLHQNILKNKNLTPKQKLRKLLVKSTDDRTNSNLIQNFKMFCRTHKSMIDANKYTCNNQEFIEIMAFLKKSVLEKQLAETRKPQTLEQQQQLARYLNDEKIFDPTSDFYLNHVSTAGYFKASVNMFEEIKTFIEKNIPRQEIEKNYTTGNSTLPNEKISFDMLEFRNIHSEIEGVKQRLDYLRSQRTKEVSPYDFHETRILKNLIWNCENQVSNLEKKLNIAIRTIFEHIRTEKHITKEKEIQQSEKELQEMLILEKYEGLPDNLNSQKIELQKETSQLSEQLTEQAEKLHANQDEFRSLVSNAVWQQLTKKKENLQTIEKKIEGDPVLQAQMQLAHIQNEMIYEQENSNALETLKSYVPVLQTNVQILSNYFNTLTQIIDELQRINYNVKDAVEAFHDSKSNDEDTLLQTLQPILFNKIAEINDPVFKKRLVKTIIKKYRSTFSTELPNTS